MAKLVHDGLLYDTETAAELARWDDLHGFGSHDPFLSERRTWLVHEGLVIDRWGWRYRLYQTPKDRLFVTAARLLATEPDEGRRVTLVEEPERLDQVDRDEIRSTATPELDADLWRALFGDLEEA